MSEAHKPHLGPHDEGMTVEDRARATLSGADDVAAKSSTESARPSGATRSAPDQHSGQQLLDKILAARPGLAAEAAARELFEQLETQRFAFTSEWRTRAEQAEATLAFQQQATAELEEQLEAAQKELRSALDDFGYDRSRTELKEQLETAQRDNERKEVWILGARDRLEQLETLRETAWAACNATSYVTDDGRVITADVALEERVSDLRRALSNPASEPEAS